MSGAQTQGSQTQGVPTQGPQTTALRRRYSSALMANYGTPPVALVAGHGCTVTDADGRRYVDFVSGIAVGALGHGHPALVSAVSRQVATLGHVSNLALHPGAVDLAERLLGLLDPAGDRDGRVFFCNSGAEANEAALKIARRHGRALDPAGGKLEVVAVETAFHGRTLGALSLTGQPAKREPFEPLPGGVRFVPHGDLDALRAAVTEATAAVFLEPVHGEAGVVVPPPGWLETARQACDAVGALLVLDEVQGGIGRTGVWFSHAHPAVTGGGAPVQPDVVTLAKGLAGGLPMGAVVGFGPAASALRPGDHGTTFGGGPVACAAALAVLDTVEREGLLAHVTDVGERLGAGLRALESPLVAGERGLGLWRALLLTADVAHALEAAARDAGWLVNAVGPRAVRFAPPLVVSAVEVDGLLAALPGLLARVLDAAPEALPAGAGTARRVLP
jgi:acetylornithine/N-succinyldiaminopimelate aminotransferase